MTTKPSIALADLLEKGADADLLREMIHHIVERVMQFDVENLCAAGYGERSPDRQNSRNGYRERLWETRAGSIAVKIPKLRSGSYFPPFLEPRRTAEKALAAVIQEAYVQGVSTRSVDELVKAMGMSGISKSQVSRLCAEIDERVNAFLARPLEGDWPYLWIDATYVKGREAGRIVSKAVIIAVAVNAEGVRELLGMAMGPSEAEPFWSDFLRSLTRRGLRGVKLVISDAHEGLKAAAAKVLAATWQRCKVHFLRNALAHAGKGQRQMVLAAINTTFAQDIVKMVAYQAESDLLALLRPHYKCVEQEGRTLLHEIFAATGEITATHNELQITLAPLSSPHRTYAAQALCELLNQTAKVFPGSALHLRFAVRPPPCIGLAFPGSPVHRSAAPAAAPVP